MLFNRDTANQPLDPDRNLGAGEEYELRREHTPRYDLSDDRELRIVKWRTECFERAGLPPLVSSEIALRKDIDRSRVESLVANGATHDQVRAIVL